MSRKPWTDYELGFIQDHEDWTHSQIAEGLGRTPSSVKQKRLSLRAGWVPTAPPEWSSAEDEFVLANPRMSQADVASHLGRTSNAVNTRRILLKRRGMTDLSFGGNWSPIVSGSRPLLAKTCPVCGLLLHAKWFSASNRKFWSRLCNKCRTAESTRPRNRKEYVGVPESTARLQDLTIPGASRKGQPWIESDFKVLSDPDMTILQKALKLQRTWMGTAAACSKGKFKSHVGLGDPERDQWIIDNPNAGDVDQIAASLAPKDPIAPAEAKKSAPAWDWDDADLAVSA